MQEAENNRSINILRAKSILTAFVPSDWQETVLVHLRDTSKTTDKRLPKLVDLLDAICLCYPDHRSEKRAQVFLGLAFNDCNKGKQDAFISILGKISRLIPRDGHEVLIATCAELSAARIDALASAFERLADVPEEYRAVIGKTMANTKDAQTSSALPILFKVAEKDLGSQGAACYIVAMQQKGKKGNELLQAALERGINESAPQLSRTELGIGTERILKHVPASLHEKVAGSILINNSGVKEVKELADYLDGQHSSQARRPIGLIGILHREFDCFPPAVARTKLTHAKTEPAAYRSPPGSSNQKS